MQKRLTKSPKLYVRDTGLLHFLAGLRSPAELPIEIKLGTAIDPRRLAGLRQCMADLGLRRGWVVTTGNDRTRLGRDIEIVPWKQIANPGFDFDARANARRRPAS